MSYVTYAIESNPHVTIHCNGCSQIKKHEGKTYTGSQGDYKDHATYQDAKKYAKNTGLPWRDCSLCNPPNCVYQTV